MYIVYVERSNVYRRHILFRSELKRVTTTHMIRLKRVYEPWNNKDGYRILVDRLWPRGLTKQKAHIDLWLKDIAPSNALRKWFAHDPKKWKEFKKKYANELQGNAAEVQKLRSILEKQKTMTLVYGAKDEVHNQALVIAAHLNKASG